MSAGICAAVTSEDASLASHSTMSETRSGSASESVGSAPGRSCECRSGGRRRAATSRVVAHRGVGAIRVHRVHPDAVLAELDRQGVGHADHTELAGAVVTTPRYGLHARGRADGDDRAPIAGLNHRGHSGFDGVPHTGQVDVEDVLPLLRRDLPESAPVQHAGVGDDDVEAARWVIASSTTRCCPRRPGHRLGRPASCGLRFPPGASSRQGPRVSRPDSHCAPRPGRTRRWRRCRRRPAPTGRNGSGPAHARRR